MFHLKINANNNVPQCVGQISDNISRYISKQEYEEIDYELMTPRKHKKRHYYTEIGI